MSHAIHARLQSLTDEIQSLVVELAEKQDRIDKLERWQRAMRRQPEPEKKPEEQYQNCPGADGLVCIDHWLYSSINMMIFPTNRKCPNCNAHT